MTEWISVTEHKPEHGKVVICYGKVKYDEHEEVVVFVGYFCLDYKERPLWFFHADAEYCGEAEVDSVTHWMPLPEKPNEG